jgi:hypothetical protein
MVLTVVSFAVDLPISTAPTVWVARTLSRNGRVFLGDVLRGDEKLADAVNRLLNRIRRRGVMEREQIPPVPPQGWAAPAAPRA